MQFTLPISLLTLLLATTSLADPVQNPASFTTWNCTDCGRTGGSACTQRPHQVPISDRCFPLEAGQNSIIVDYAAPGTTCSVYLYGTNNCTGSGPVFGFENNARNCKPIPVNERSSYQVLCN